jgi:hypothetical protein
MQHLHGVDFTPVQLPYFFNPAVKFDTTVID